MTSSTYLARFDDFCERWGERMNPIVVKETRQAIKSRAFPIAFLAMLSGCWLISVLGIVDYGEQLYFAEAGDEFFSWYLGALLAAICFVVPMGVFRSVVAEFEGHTFEMLAITALAPRNVVFGKLKSATLQMGAYFAAIAPFVCFTYLLEGVSIPGLLLALVIAFLAGLSACMGGMMLGALAKQSAWQIFCMLLLIVLGMICFGIGQSSGTAAAKYLGGWGSIGAACAGFGCFGYVFLFFSLLTLGVSIAQFTPTMPRPGNLSAPPGLSRARLPRPPASNDHRVDARSGGAVAADTPEHRDGESSAADRVVDPTSPTSVDPSNWHSNG
ncbi:MAG: ABC transporter permease [Planctomycetaceae bacterium]